MSTKIEIDFNNFIHFNDKKVQSICIYEIKNNYRKILFKINGNVLYLIASKLKKKYLHFSIDLNQDGIFRDNVNLYIPKELARLKIFEEDLEACNLESWIFGLYVHFSVNIFEEVSEFYTVFHSPTIYNLKESIQEKIRHISDDILYNNTECLDDGYVEEELEEVKKEINSYKDIKERYSKLEEKELLNLLIEEVSNTEYSDCDIWSSPYEEEE